MVVHLKCGVGAIPLKPAASEQCTVCITVQYSTVQYSTVCTWSHHYSVSPDDVMVAIVELLGPVQHGDVLGAQVVGHGQVALGLEYRHNVVTIHGTRAGVQLKLILYKEL